MRPDWLQAWADDNSIPENMRWKMNALQQIKAFKKFGEEITPGEELQVISTHTSKSIKLPVVAMRVKNGFAVLRDNFHDICMSVLWDFIPDVKLSQVYTPRDWDWYLEQMERKKNSTFKGWTEEEMEDPRILRVQVTNLREHTYWTTIDGAAKDRWLQRWEDPSWMTKDWSSGKVLVEGSFGPGCRLYKPFTGYAEGMGEVPPDQALELWEPGFDKGLFCVGTLDEAREILKVFTEAQPAYFPGAHAP